MYRNPKTQAVTTSLKDTFIIRRMTCGASKLLFFLIVSLLAFSGCYEVDQEVISPADAAQVAGLAGSYTSYDGSTVISEVVGTNDYRFRKIPVRGTIGVGSMRAVPLRDNIYIVQIKYDNEPGYFIDFMEFNGDRFIELTFDMPDGERTRLAGDFNVKFEDDFIIESLYLKGDRVDILSFLKAHDDFRAKPMAALD